MGEKRQTAYPLGDEQALPLGKGEIIAVDFCFWGDGVSSSGGLEGLRQRQHAEWRLMRLAEIDLSRADRATVSKFRRYANSIDGLGKSKLPVITALEEKYWEQRRQATAKRAVQIGTLLR